MTQKYQAEICVIGGGLAGIKACLELLDQDKKVILLERDSAEHFGGQAKQSFGGIFMVETPTQKLNGISDSTELAFQDWCEFAEFAPDDEIPKAWAKQYIEHSLEDLYYDLKKYRVKFFPVVHWVERGLYTPGNSVPRFHMVWGTGFGLIQHLLHALETHPKRAKLKILFQHNVQDIQKGWSCRGQDESKDQDFEIQSEQVIIACGGIGANLNLVRKHWHPEWQQAPKRLLIGCHRYADGQIHQNLEKNLKVKVTHLDKMWNYAAGVQTQDKAEGFGLSLVPPKSALWMNAFGKRIGPTPLITAFDTRSLVTEICKEPKQFSWQILNWKIACKELAVSGSEYNDAIRDKKFFSFLKNVLIGNPDLVKRLIKNSDDFVVANDLNELVEKMNALEANQDVQYDQVLRDIERYDAQIERGKKFHNDDQLRRIAQLREYRGDKARTCHFQKILDPKAFPLIAIRLRILVRKSLGGIKTNLNSQVLNDSDEVVPGLYAVGEAAGFGGGGIHGLRTLEGTFLGSCILNAKFAVRSIIKGN